MRKIWTIMLIGLALRLFVSCCDCPTTTDYRYKYSSVEIFHINNTGQTPVVGYEGVIPKEAYGIQIELSLSTLAFSRPSNYMSFQSAYAYDCQCPPDIQYLAQDTISQISIISLNKFDSSHLADSDVTDYFKVLTSNKYNSIQEFIDNSDTNYYEKPENEIMDIYLLHPPSHKGEHKFRVDILLSDGTILSATTTAINLE